MIYIVVYKEVSLALTLDSAHTKIWLQDLHKNIQGVYKKVIVRYLGHVCSQSSLLTISFPLNSSASPRPHRQERNTILGTPRGIAVLSNVHSAHLAALRMAANMFQILCSQ